MIKKKHYRSVVIGGGAAGFFAAIKCAESHPGNVLLLEKTQVLLSKVKISGGGRCNVTHSCFDPAELVKNYPRGKRELRGPFAQFQPRDTIDWFKSRGVKLKTEPDGRMFPVTDNSQTIINCLRDAAQEVEIATGKNAVKIEREETVFRIYLKSGEEITAETLMLASGGSTAGHALAKELGHTIIPPVPSLFTFNVPNSPLHDLAGVSVPQAKVSLPEFRSEQTGPLLITHWGFSGPAVLKLSAFCARELQDLGYRTHCLIDWCPETSQEELREIIQQRKLEKTVKSIVNDPLVLLPKQLWKALVFHSGIEETARPINLSKSKTEDLIHKLKRDRYEISGKTTYKQEFVTSGGVKLSEVNFSTMESKIVPGLFFGGEILDIDGITGGFNFQAAWTTGWLAGRAMSFSDLDS